MNTDLVATARARTERIRNGMLVLAQWQQDVIDAYTSRDWATLGYPSWDAYLDGEYGEHRIRLPREQRREIVASMTQAGMSTRAIGAAIGVDQKTVLNDRTQPTEENSSVPDTVLSLDGRQRPGINPNPPSEEPLTAAERQQFAEQTKLIRHGLDEARDGYVDLLIGGCSPAWVAGELRKGQRAHASTGQLIPQADEIIYGRTFDFLAAVQIVTDDATWSHDDPQMRIWLDAWWSARQPDLRPEYAAHFIVQFAETAHQADYVRTLLARS